MRPIVRLLGLGGCLALGLTFALAPGSSRAADGTLTGFVGPDFEIGFSNASVPAGSYTLTVDDRAAAHNFDLLSPSGASVFTTGVADVGTKSATVTLTSGTWTYQCDVHSKLMYGTFAVTGNGTSSETTETSTTTTTTTAATRLSVGRASVRGRIVRESVSASASARASLTLLRRGVRVARASFGLTGGTKLLRLRAPSRSHGRHVLLTVLTAADGTRVSARRSVTLR